MTGETGRRGLSFPGFGISHVVLLRSGANGGHSSYIETLSM